MPPALIASGHLKTLVARVRHAGGAVSETILLWLALRQLFDSLAALFNAWKAGELPPLPAPAPQPAPRAQLAPPNAPAAPKRAIAAPRPKSIRPIRRASNPRVLPRPATCPTLAPRITAPYPPPPRIKPREAPISCPLQQKSPLPRRETRAIFIPMSKLNACNTLMFHQPHHHAPRLRPALNPGPEQAAPNARLLLAQRRQRLGDHLLAVARRQ